MGVCITLQEAIKSGKRFRRNKGNWLFHDQSCGMATDGIAWVEFKINDILTDDWEIEEPKVEITRTKLNEVLIRSAKLNIYPDTMEKIFEDLGL